MCVTYKQLWEQPSTNEMCHNQKSGFHLIKEKKRTLRVFPFRLWWIFIGIFVLKIFQVLVLTAPLYFQYGSDDKQLFIMDFPGCCGNNGFNQPCLRREEFILNKWKTKETHRTSVTHNSSSHPDYLQDNNLVPAQYIEPK